MQIRFSDIDPLNHVNNSCIFQYYDVGRIHYLTDVLQESLKWSETTIVIVHIDADFLNPILQNDNIEVQTRISRIGNKSVTISQRIIDDKGLIKSTCVSIMSGFDRQKGQSTLIPQDFKQRFLDYEGVSSEQDLIS